MNEVTTKIKRFMACVALGAFAALSPTLAQAQIVLPDLGVDGPGTITTIGTSAGVFVVSAILLFAALVLARMVMKWIRRATAG